MYRRFKIKNTAQRTVTDHHNTQDGYIIHRNTVPKNQRHCNTANPRVPIMKVSMGLTDWRKTAKNLVDSRKN